MAPLVVEDLLASLYYADIVLSRTGPRFDASAPLITSDDYAPGALCALETEPWQVSPLEMTALVDLAAIVMAQIELRHAFIRIGSDTGMPTRGQFRDGLIYLARDRPGKGRFAVIIDFACDEQISRVARAMRAGRSGRADGPHRQGGKG